MPSENLSADSIMKERVVYAGRDLEAMSFAANYHRWILEFFKPYLSRHLVEVGAGTGSFSEMIAALPITSLTLIEPSDSMHAVLRQNVEQFGGGLRVNTFNACFTDVADEIKRVGTVDSIIYVNVLEHISDDEGELNALYQTLPKGGRLFIFVPACQWLYGGLDREIGHFRRYSKNELEEKCRQAGFTIVASRYFDLLGVAPWWVKYRFLKSTKMEAGAVKFYDKYFVPLTKKIESIIPPPIGKNIILVAER
jgi:SAM-dependent methyltransferase